MACCLPTCAQGSSVPNTGNLGIGLFWALGNSLRLVHMGSISVAILPVVYKGGGTWVT